MKKIIIGAAMLFALSAHASPSTIDLSIIKNFKESFPSAQGVRWNETSTYSQVSFTENDVRCFIYYNLEGETIGTLRYYGEKKLCPFIALKAKEKIKNKTIKGVVELQNRDGLVYEIIMEDENSIVVLNSDANGNIQVKNKLKKA